MPVSLYDSLLERLEGRPYSNYFAAWCPFDSHQTPALLIYEDGMGKCLSCGRWWTHEQIDRKIGTHYIPQNDNTVSKVLPHWRNWEKRYGSLEDIAYYAHKSMKKHTQLQEYFRKRKIYEFADEGMLGVLDGWAVFPVFDQTHKVVDLVVRATRNLPGVRYVVSPSVIGRHSLYVPSWEKVLKNPHAFIVYGIIDSVSLHLAGATSVTGTTGKSLNPELLLPLQKRFTIIPDYDEEKEAHILANKLGWRCRVKQIDYSKFEKEEQEIKDPDGIRRYFGDEALLQAIL